MKPEERALAFAEAMQADGMPAWVIYHDATGWHLAGPKVAGYALAEGLRSVAEQYESRMRQQLN